MLFLYLRQQVCSKERVTGSSYLPRKEIQNVISRFCVYVLRMLFLGKGRA